MVLAKQHNIFLCEDLDHLFILHLLAFRIVQDIGRFLLRQYGCGNAQTGNPRKKLFHCVLFIAGVGFGNAVIKGLRQNHVSDRGAPNVRDWRYSACCRIRSGWWGLLPGNNAGGPDR